MLFRKRQGKRLIPIEPYFQNAQVTIFNADMLGVLPQYPALFFDFAIADPPYGIDESNESRMKSRSKLARSGEYRHGVYGGGANVVRAGEYSNVFEWDKVRWQRENFSALILAAKGYAVFGANHYSPYLPPSSGWVFWDKDNGASDFSDGELIYTSKPCGVRVIRYKWNGMLQEDMGNKEKRLYPTQKPKPLVKRLITQYANLAPGSVILDPCMGSGTTLKAAVELGFRAVGIDVSRAACDIAINRLIGGDRPPSRGLSKIALYE